MSLTDKLKKPIVAGIAAAAIAGYAFNPSYDSDTNSIVPKSVMAAEQKSEPEIGVDYEALAKNIEGILKNKKNCQQVIDLLNKYREDIENESFIYFNNLGLAYNQCGKINEAEKMYKRAIELEPDDAIPRNNLGYLYLRSIRTQESKKLAKEQFEYVVKNIDPKNRTANFYLKKISGT